MCATKRGAHLALSASSGWTPCSRRPPSASACRRPFARSTRSRPSSAGGRPVTVVQPPVRKTFDLQVVVPVEDMTALGEPTGDLSPGRRPAPQRARLDLAARRGARARPDRGAPLDDRVRQLAPAGRAADRPAERTGLRAGRRTAAPGRACTGRADGRVGQRPSGGRRGRRPRAPRLGLARAARPSSRRISRPAGCPRSSRPPRSNWASTWARSTSSCRSSRRRRSRPGCSGSAAPGTRSARCRAGVIFPKYRGDLVECAVVAERMRDGAIESMRYPRNPLDVLAQQIVAMVAMRAHDRRRGRGPDPPGRPVRRAAALGPRGGARHAGRPLPVRRVRRAAPAPGVGPRHRRADRRAAAPSGWRSPAAARSPTAACSACSSPVATGRAGGSANSTRRWSTSRGSATSSCSARRRGASRRSPTTGCWSRRRRARSGGCRSGRATRPAGRSSSAGRSARSSARCRDGCTGEAAASAARGRRARRVGRRQPADLPRRAARRHRPPARRPDHPGRALPRRARRLAAGRPLAVRRTGERAVGAGDRRPAARAVRRLDVATMHSDDGIVLRLPDTDGEPPTAEIVVFDADEIEPLVTAEVGGSALFASRFRECAARSLLLPRRDPRRRTAAVAAAPAGEPTAAGRQRVRPVPGRARSDARVPAGRLRRARARRADARHRISGGAHGRGRDASGVAVRPVAAVRLRRHVPLRGRRAAGRAPGPGAVARPGAARRTARLRPSCASCSTPTRSTTSSRSCSGSRPIARRTASTALHDLLRWRRRSEHRRGIRTRRDAARPRPSSRPTRRAIRVRIAGEERWLAIEDAGRLRDALGRGAAGRRARGVHRARRATRSAIWSRATPARTDPFHADGCRDPPGLGVAVVDTALERLAAPGGSCRASSARAAPGWNGATPRCCGSIRRRSLAALRTRGRAGAGAGAGPVHPGCGRASGRRSARGVDGLLRVIEQLAGAPLPASAAGDAGPAGAGR